MKSYNKYNQTSEYIILYLMNSITSKSYATSPNETYLNPCDESVLNFDLNRIAWLTHLSTFEIEATISKKAR